MGQTGMPTWLLEAREQLAVLKHPNLDPRDSAVCLHSLSLLTPCSVLTAS